MRLAGLCLITVSLLAFNTYAAQTEITIYNQNLALLKKNQAVDLKVGVNEIIFDEVAEKMKPESAYIYGNGIRVLEQNYDYAGINYMTMLNANVGKKVKTVRQNPETGENIFETALLLATDGVTPVLKFDYGIETAFSGRVVFDEVPAVLNSTPVLMAKVEATQQGQTDLNLAYLAEGFSWNANYIARVNDEQTLTLIGRAAITNNSGSGYEAAKVNLVAGDVNIVQEYLRPRMMAKSVQLMNAVAYDTAEAVISEPMSMDSYYIYNIPGTTTLKNGQMKQISFINAPTVKYEKEGVLTSSIYFGGAKSSYKDVHPAVYYRFENAESDGLGMPLPQGKISFYASDDNGSMQFIGENTIGNTAKGQKISLQLGKFFDVFGEGQVKAVRQVSDYSSKKYPNDKCQTITTVYRYDINYKVTNTGKKDVNVVLRQPLSNSARILQETLKGQAGEGNSHEWHFNLKANAVQEIKVEAESQSERRECAQ